MPSRSAAFQSPRSRHVIRRRAQPPGKCSAGPTPSANFPGGKGGFPSGGNEPSRRLSPTLLPRLPQLHITAPQAPAAATSKNYRTTNPTMPRARAHFLFRLNKAPAPADVLFLWRSGGLPCAWLAKCYEVTSTKYTRDIYKELLISLVASLFMGFGVLFLLLWVGIYV
uniref:Dolichyl-diphosphooligosaccharide-protein glycosyltransferase subunit TMEM258 n=1 Tax=Suricata suricatta TaxID=37032 RepID=A0A673TU64_SURSU